jgi:hypothetical protein
LCKAYTTAPYGFLTTKMPLLTGLNQMNNSMHPLFEAILRPYAPPAPLPTPESIDAAMLADKLTDGYNLRKIDTAIKLEQQNANPEN